MRSARRCGRRLPIRKCRKGSVPIYEIVINGLDAASVQVAMKVGILAATATGGVTHIGASNFGGKLGPYRFSLHESVPLTVRGHYFFSIRKSSGKRFTKFSFWIFLKFKNFDL